MPALVFTVDEFLAAHRLPRFPLYALWQEGLSPVSHTVGSRTFLSFDAAERWRRVPERAATRRGRAGAGPEETQTLGHSRKRPHEVSPAGRLPTTDGRASGSSCDASTCSVRDQLWVGCSGPERVWRRRARPPD